MESNCYESIITPEAQLPTHSTSGCVLTSAITPGMSGEEVVGTLKEEHDYLLHSDGGGVIEIKERGFFQVASTLDIDQRVSLKGLGTSNTIFQATENMTGPMFFGRATVGTNSTLAGTKQLLADFSIRGQLVGVTSKTGSISGNYITFTSVPNSVAVGSVVEASGVPEGARVISISGNVVTMDVAAGSTPYSTPVNFRDATQIVTANTISGSNMLTVSTPSVFTVGDMLVGTSMRDLSYIREISGNILKISRTARSTGSSPVYGVKYVSGIVLEGGTDNPENDASRTYLGSTVRNVDVIQASGDAIASMQGRSQTNIEHCHGVSCRGNGLVLNSCSDSTISFSGFGSCWRNAGHIITSATPRIISTEFWQTVLNDRYFELVSQNNQQLTFNSGEVNGTVKISNKTTTEFENIVLDNVNFKFTDKNLRSESGTQLAYINADDSRVVTTNCLFAPASSGAAPNFAFRTSGTGEVYKSGLPISSSAYVVSEANNPAAVFSI